MSDLIFQKAADKDTERIFTLYQSLVGTPYCAWDEDYPNLEIVRDDIAAKGLYTRSRGPELLAAGTIRHCCEHDTIFCRTPMKNPCDLMRIGVACFIIAEHASVVDSGINGDPPFPRV